MFFDYWWGMTNLPVCDGTNTEWQQYIYGEGGIIDLWFSLGIDGLRLDVADELSDEFIEDEILLDDEDVDDIFDNELAEDNLENDDDSFEE